MCRVEIDGKVYTVDKGTLLSHVLMAEGSRAYHPCGGKGICKRCAVKVNGETVLSCQYRIEKDISVELPEKSEIESPSGAVVSFRKTDNIAFVLDIGTTTLVLGAVSLDSGEIIGVKTSDNPQITFGADVISRIEYCMKNGVKPLQKALTDEINRMISSLGMKGQVLYASGNTTMLHTFFGEDCSSMGVAPYKPKFLEGRRISGEEINIKNVGIVESIPCIHTFAGGDIVAGINLVGKPEKGKYYLLADIGTNAEIILIGDEKLLCTSAAAGPCLEGCGISCGMSATEGAICSYEENKIHVIGGVSPKGICGTALIDVVAHLLKKGIADETGYMEEPFDICGNVYLSPEDIREYQLAKSAICSGILTLLKKGGVAFADIEKVYLSGGFSSRINTENAVATGLIPKGLGGKCIALNNSSLLGAVKYALEKNDLEEIGRSAEYIDLSEETYFSEQFIENMIFNTGD